MMQSLKTRDMIGCTQCQLQPGQQHLAHVLAAKVVLLSIPAAARTVQRWCRQFETELAHAIQ
jgi:hypothetical protein